LFGFDYQLSLVSKNAQVKKFAMLERSSQVPSFVEKGRLFQERQHQKSHRLNITPSGGMPRLLLHSVYECHCQFKKPSISYNAKIFRPGREFECHRRLLKSEAENSADFDAVRRLNRKTAACVYSLFRRQCFELLRQLSEDLPERGDEGLVRGRPDGLCYDPPVYPRSGPQLIWQSYRDARTIHLIKAFWCTLSYPLIGNKHPVLSG
jgi:hypothetical protein